MNKVIMPRELTAENGAKAIFRGEFHETREIKNDAYCGCGDCEDCDMFPDKPETIIEKVAVSWTTIKEIYSRAVKEFATEIETGAASEKT